MSDTIIRVENLGKKYVIGHQQQREKYTALRDVITNGVKGLTHHFNPKSKIPNPKLEEFWALKDVSFEVKRGDRVGIIGRNGAGKSTLLKILSRITEPTTGRIQIKGRVASLLEVGTGFHPELTGRENIYLNGAILGMGKQEIRRKFDEIVAFAEVEKFLDTPVKRYSSGMYVRLAFAVAAHLEPEILVVDEVLAVGDAQFQKKCLGKMEDVATNEGRTVLFVSHNMGVITQLCNQAIYLEKGQVVESNSVNHVVTRYLNSIVSDRSHVHLSKNKENQNKLAFFTELMLTNAEGQKTTEIDVRYPFYVCLEYEVKENIENLEITIRIDTNDGKPLFTSSFSDSSHGNMRQYETHPGFYTAKIEIPGMFLMPGSYLLSIGLHKPLACLYDLYEHLTGFSVIETGSDLAKYNDPQKLGVIIPKLRWMHEKVLPQSIAFK